MEGGMGAGSPEPTPGGLCPFSPTSCPGVGFLGGATRGGTRKHRRRTSVHGGGGWGVGAQGCPCPPLPLETFSGGSHTCMEGRLLGLRTWGRVWRPDGHCAASLTPN